MKYTHKSFALMGAMALSLAACNLPPAPQGLQQPSSAPSTAPSSAPTAMPTSNPTPAPTATPDTAQNIANGREVFRFETFGNEDFWTDTAQLPQGIVAAGITPVQALQLGHHVDVEALSPDIVEVVAAELQTDLSPENAPTLNDPQTTVALINANAVVGVVPIDSNNDGTLDVASGDKVGISCVLCHGQTDKSVFALDGGGSIGARVDGPAADTLNVGAILATAANSKSLYPLAQLASPGGSGRAPASVNLTPDSTEADFDAYFNNPDYYPVGTFDVSFDGVGNPAPNPALFGETLQAPFGGPLNLQDLEDFNNVVYTALMDPTGITNPIGRQVAGNELVDDYIQILEMTGASGYPHVEATATNVSNNDSLIGLRVDEQKLQDMNVYLRSLRAPE